VSGENVEIIRRMYEAFHRGDAEGALDHFDPEVLVDASNARFDVPVGNGPEYVGALVSSWISAFDEWSEEIEEIRDFGSRVLVLSVQRGRGKGSGVAVEARYAILYDVDGGTITSLRMYRNPEAALEVAGLPE
jgi:ketosteroid isomerase-like protein